MSGDLEARVVQAAREAVAKEYEEIGFSATAEWIRAGQEDDSNLNVTYAILGARAALAEIERGGVVVPKDPTDLMLAVAAREASKDAEWRVDEVVPYDECDNVYRREWREEMLAAYKAFISLAVPRA